MDLSDYLCGLCKESKILTVDIKVSFKTCHISFQTIRFNFGFCFFLQKQKNAVIWLLPLTLYSLGYSTSTISFIFELFLRAWPRRFARALRAGSSRKAFCHEILYSLCSNTLRILRLSKNTKISVEPLGKSVKSQKSKMISHLDEIILKVLHAVTITPDFSGNEGSFCVIVSNRQAVPSGWFLPDSHASTVLGETPIYFAKSTCVNPVARRILFISSAVKDSNGWIERTVTFAFPRPFLQTYEVLQEFRPSRYHRHVYASSAIGAQ